jgi:hypothetical protein
MSLQWVVDALRAAGLVVHEYPGWQDNAASGSFAPRAVMWHHDASAFGPSPSIPAMIADQGNSSTPPPLAHCWVDTAGAWTMTANGRANHAGTGAGWGQVRRDQGNTDALGFETDHTTGEAWPSAQLAGLRLGTAAIMAHAGWDPWIALCGHKEYTDRKPDPDGLDMNTERREVVALIEGGLMAGVDWDQSYKFGRTGYATAFGNWVGETNDAAGQAMLTAYRIEAKLDALAGELTNDEAHILAAVRAVNGGSMTDAQVAALAAAINAATPDLVTPDMLADALRSAAAELGKVQA